MATPPGPMKLNGFNCLWRGCAGENETWRGDMERRHGEAGYGSQSGPVARGRENMGGSYPTCAARALGNAKWCGGDGGGAPPRLDGTSQLHIRHKEPTTAP